MDSGQWEKFIMKFVSMNNYGHKEQFFGQYAHARVGIKLIEVC